MYRINEKEFKTLDEAMKYAQSINEFVVIKGNDMEICGKFGVDSVSNGRTPDGWPYDWMKRRK